MKFNVICGLPRSGSTLLCNILNQNPKFYASSTSGLCSIVTAMSATVSQSMEVKSDLAHNKEESELRIQESIRGAINGWYSHQTKPVVFDKSRGWVHYADMLLNILPDSKIVVCVRDLRDVFASIEKQHQKYPIFNEMEGLIERSVLSRADRLFGPQGLIGLPVIGIEDILRRRIRAVSFLKYEHFAAKPIDALKTLYYEIGEDWFEHDVKNVKNVSTDCDAIYLNKFPHDGSGEVRPPDPLDREKWCPGDIRTLIMQKFQAYNTAFGYTGV